MQDPVALGRIVKLEEVNKGPSPEQIRKQKEEAMQKELEEVVKQIPGDKMVDDDIATIGENGWYKVTELNLPQGAIIENLKVEGESQQQYKNFDHFVKAENGKILYGMTRGGAELKATITGKIVYEKDGVRQEKEFTSILRWISNYR